MVPLLSVNITELLSLQQRLNGKFSSFKGSDIFCGAQSITKIQQLRLFPRNNVTVILDNPQTSLSTVIIRNYFLPIHTKKLWKLSTETKEKDDQIKSSEALSTENEIPFSDISRVRLHMSRNQSGFSRCVFFDISLREDTQLSHGGYSLQTATSYIMQI